MADVGVSGTMVAAVLESAGFLWQSYVLDEMLPVFKGSLGGFIYLIGVVVAIFSFASRGNYRLVAWLLIGPPLFFSFVIPRTDAPNSQWKFAQQDRRQDKVTREVERIAENAGLAGNAKVATLFARYDKLVSATTQEMAKIINNSKKDTDKMFVFRGQLFSKLYSKSVEEADFGDFIHTAFFTNCAEFIAAARDKNDDSAGEAKKQAAEKVWERFGQAFVVLSPRAARYIAADELGDAATASAEGLKQLDQRTEEVMRRVYSCEQVWNIVREGMITVGERLVKELKGTAESNDIDVDAMMKQIRKGALGDANASDETLAKVVAKHMLRNELYRGSHAGLINWLADAGKQARNVEIAPEDDPTQVEQARVAQTEYAEMTRMLQSAASLPYYQGLALFFLAIAYPFFCCLLLVPGKHPAVMLWFLMWLWVKSWDVGMAAAMQVDDILFSMFSFAKKGFAEHEQINDDLSRAIVLIHNSDPTFHMSTYYNIMAVLIYSIPILTSQLILGGLSGGAGLISAGMRTANDWFASSTQAWSNQLPVRNLKLASQDMKRSAVQMDADRNYARNGKSRYGMLSAGERKGFEHASAAQRQQTMGRYLPHPSKRAQAYKEQVAGMMADAINSTRAGGQRVGKGLIAGDGRGMRGEGYDARREQALGRQALLGFLQEAGDQDIASKRGLVLGYDPIGRKSAPNAGIYGWQKLYRKVMKTVGKAGATITQAEIEAQMSDLDAEAMSDMAWSVYDEIYSNEVQDLAAQARLYGVLDVPWTAETGGIAESNRDLTEYKNQMMVLTQYLAAYEQIFRDAGDHYESWKDLKANREYHSKAIQSLKDQGIPDDVIKKVDFFDPDFKKNMQDLFKDDGSGLQDIYRSLWSNIGSQMSRQKRSLPNLP